jgi:HK97 family phage prohead protease
MEKIEYRTAELRAATAAFEVAGRAASYNTPSGDLGGFVERLQPGCFTRSLASGDHDVKCLMNHDANLVLGRQANKTLTLTDTPEGLNFVCKLNKESQAHRDLYASVKRGDLSECSFAFIVDGEGGQSFSSPDRNGLLTRTIKRAKLLDCSIVTSPAYGNGATSVAARAANSAPAADIHVQIALWNARHKRRIADARSQFAEYSPLTAEEIVRCKKLRYSEDTVLALRSAAYAREIRYEQGQSADPSASLREGELDDPASARTKEEHERAVQYHRNQAQYAQSLQRCVACHSAANAHLEAARTYPNASASSAARAASKALKG